MKAMPGGELKVRLVLKMVARPFSLEEGRGAGIEHG
jgi:hypothetical protein